MKPKKKSESKSKTKKSKRIRYKPPGKSYYKDVLAKVGSTNARAEEIIKAFRTIFTWGNEVTDAHIKNRGKRIWPIQDQLMHSVSELGEIYECIRQGKCDVEITEEMVDAVFSCFTNFRIYALTRLQKMKPADYDKLLDDAIRKTFFKVNTRVNDPKYRVEA